MRTSPDTAYDQEIYDRAEMQVLGGILVSEGALLDDIRLVAEDFREPRRGEWFQAMRSEFESGRPVTAITVAGKFPPHAGEIFALTDYAMGYSRGVFVEVSEKVRARGMFRRVWSATDGIRSIGVEDSSADDILNIARETLDRMAGLEKIEARRVDEILVDVLDAINAEDGLFVPTPWPSLDRVIGGFRPGTLTVVAARPGVGKSVIAAQIAHALALHGTVAFSSLEMSGEEIVRRYIASTLRINVAKITNNALTSDDLAKIHGRRREIEAIDVRVDDRAGVGAAEISSFARTVARTGKLSGVVVDYMQLMTYRGAGSKDRREVVDEFSRGLKILSKELQVPVIALSQLNRKVEDRAEPIPKISDLRESGSIEQDADTVILLRREGDFPQERIILDVAKHRHGKPGEVELDWQGIYSRAEDLMWHPDERIAS